MSRFPEFWVLYPAGPRKVNKRGCEAKWKARHLDAIADVIIYGLRAWINSEQWQERNGVFVPLPATWLNQDRWEAAAMLTPAKRSSESVATTQSYLAALADNAQAAKAVPSEAIQRAKEARQRVMQSRLSR